MATNATTKTSKMHRRLQTPKEARQPLGTNIDANTVWDDLNILYKNTDTNINNIGANIIYKVEAIISDPIKKDLLDEQSLEKYLGMIENDIVNFKSKIEAIYESHKNKSGGASEPDEYMLALNLYGRYEEAVSIFNTNINEYINDLSIVLDKAESDAVALQQNNQSPDTNVPEDTYTPHPEIIEAEFKMAEEK